MEKKWTTVIEPKGKWFDLKLKEVWKYRDLIGLFVRRNFVTRYKQTILGPLWFIIQPIFTTIMHTIIFGNLAGLGPEGVPAFLFYMAGNVPWVFFSSCLNSTSGTFTGNAGIFGKVYFPRLVAPISTILTCMIDFSLQFVMLAGFEAYFMLTGAIVCPRWELLLLPLMLLQMSLLGMGLGIIVSSLTTKYRDLSVLVGFGVSLWMYATPVVYSMSSIAGNQVAYTLIMLNPVSPVVELFKYATLGPMAGTFDLLFWGISWAVTLVVLFVGIIIFNKIERNFMDTV